MKHLLLLVIAMIAISCDKEYSYIEIVKRTDLHGKRVQTEETKIFKAENDTLAYLTAYKSFCVSKAAGLNVSIYMGEKQDRQLVGFKLLTNDGVDISEIEFSSKEVEKKKIYTDIFNNLPKSDESHSKETFKIDSAKIKELGKYFSIEIDEFSRTNLTWYKPNSAPKYVNVNAIYCYFQTENGIPGNLRLRIQYAADNWLFFNTVKVSASGLVYGYTPHEVKRDNGRGGIWEWCDEQVNDYNRCIVDALMYANEANIKFFGDKYTRVNSITIDQITSIKQTVELYTAMGGKY